MWIGITYALVAGLLWGLVFVTPALLPEYPPALLSVGRYLAFGLIALPLGGFGRASLSQLTRGDWLEALKLAAIGNLLYYLCLASAIQRAGVPLPTMIIGTLPIVIAITANLRNGRRDGRLPWHKLAPALALIGLGIACVNHTEQAALNTNPTADFGRYASGAVLAVGALVCWTWYPLRNADWLRAHPERSPGVWATAQGLATLPLAVIGYGLVWGTMAWDDSGFTLPLGPRPLAFAALMLALGLLASWLGTRCWNEASQRLPTALAGQLIVFETLAALAYAFLLRGTWPNALTQLGIGLLMAGVLWGVRIKPVSVPVTTIDPASINQNIRPEHVKEHGERQQAHPEPSFKVGKTRIKH